MKLATTTGDFSQYFSDADDVPQMLSIFKDCGFKNIDLSFYNISGNDSIIYTDKWEDWGYNIANTAAKLGLEFVQAHSTDSLFEEGEDKDYKNFMICRQIEICEKLGIKDTVVHGVCKWDITREEFMQKNKELYLGLLKFAEKFNVNILTENTCKKNNPFYYLLDSKDYFELKEKINHPLFGYCWDVGHAHIEGVNQYEEIMAIGSDLKAIHIHDNDKHGDTHVMPYLGTISMDEIMNGLIDSEYRGVFTLEACSSLRPANYWQGDRNKFDNNILAEPPLELAIKMEEALYICGKYILEKYNCFN